MTTIFNSIVSLYRKSPTIIKNYEWMACAGTDGQYMTLFRKINSVWTMVNKKSVA